MSILQLYLICLLKYGTNLQGCQLYLTEQTIKNFSEMVCTVVEQFVSPIPNTQDFLGHGSVPLFSSLPLHLSLVSRRQSQTKLSLTDSNESKSQFGTPALKPNFLFLEIYCQGLGFLLRIVTSPIPRCIVKAFDLIPKLRAMHKYQL